MKILIGLVGEKGSGKEEFGNILHTLVGRDERFASRGPILIRQRFSDILNETLKNWDISNDRANLQKLAQVMNHGFGEGTLTRAVRARFIKDESWILIADGVRWESDEAMIRSIPNNILIYITASPQTRYERSKQRIARTGESEKTFEQFCEEEQAPNEIHISRIGSRADVRIDNIGSIEDFREAVRACYEEWIIPRLKQEGDKKMLVGEKIKFLLAYMQREACPHCKKTDEIDLEGDFLKYLKESKEDLRFV